MTIQDRAEKALSRIHSVFTRLILSYIILVMLVAIMVSGISYLYFQGKYNAELANFHELYLKNIEKELEVRLMDSSKGVYMDLTALLNQTAGDLLTPEESSLEEPGKIYNTFLILSDLAAKNYDGIEAIHLYYVKSNILISSSGYSVEGGNPLQGSGRGWYEDLAAQGLKSDWSIYDRPEYFGIQAMSIFRTLKNFPILATPEDSSVIICIDYRADFVRETMKRLLPGDSGALALMRPGSGELLGMDSSLAWDEGTMSQLGRLLSRKPGTITGETSRTSSGLVRLTVMPLADSGWYLVNAVNFSRLYQRGADIRLVLVLIALGAIVLGAVASRALTSGIYNPLDRILSRSRSLWDVASGVAGGEASGRSARGRDEYEELDSALEGISVRMDELTATIEANRPVIKNEAVVRLLEGEPVEIEELEESLAILGLSGSPLRLGTALLSLPPAQDAASKAGREAISMLKYRVAGELEASFPRSLLTGILHGRQVGIILDLAEREEGSYAEILEACEAKARELAGPGPYLAAGPLVSSYAELGGSFAVARSLTAFHFIYPELPVLHDRPALLARSGRSALPDGDFLSALALCLRNRDLEGFRAQIERFRLSARSGDCTVHACRDGLEAINACVVATGLELRADAASGLGKNLGDLLAESSSLDSYMEELSSVAADICAGDGNPQRLRNAALVGRIQEHVKANLPGDLSLDRVGEAMAVSPGYMCKIFKETTGKNFVSYVTEQRLLEAARILKESREPIQEIGRRVGFNTPAYFARVFKERFGLSPLEYRRKG